jgi:N-acetylneuraminic acid mutarotase
MLEITYHRGPDLPQGFQDSAGGFLGDHLVTACGFCSGGDTGTRPEKYPRGFLRKAWALDLSREGGTWEALPAFPGQERQGLFATVVGKSLYYWGGFSYTEPCCYADGYRLRRTSKGWAWETLPELPWKLSFSGICSVDSRIYVLGGHDYDNREDGGGHTVTDRTGQIDRLGSRLLSINVRKLKRGWQHLPECPGTPRGGSAVAAAHGKIYVVGGAVGAVKHALGRERNPEGVGTCSVVDNWVYDPAKEAWERLRDSPVSSGGFPSGAIVYKDRYVLLVGGHQWGNVLNQDLTLRKDYGQATRFEGKGAYFGDVFVYDTQTDLFGTADNLPMNNFFPMTVIRDDVMHLIGGETGGSTHDGVYYAHHPDLYLRGTIREAGQ